MKEHLHDATQVLVYVLELVIAGQLRSVILQPIDPDNGVVLEESADGSGIMRGRLVSGGLLEIPAAAIKNVFPQWWKKTDNQSGQGSKGWWMDDEVVEKHATNDIGNASKWDENGCHKEIEGREKLPDDVKSSRIVRGDGDKRWWE